MMTTGSELGNAQETGTIEVLVKDVIDLAEGIRAYELISPTGGRLPTFTAGAHIDVHLPGGLIRQYSLCNPPTETDRYVIAVLREPNGRGGSVVMHEQIRPGSALQISRPRNNFSLSPDAEQFIFIAGGIGITPILSMMSAAQEEGKKFQLYFCTRSPARTPFMDKVQPLVENGRAILHHDFGDLDKSIDLHTILRDRDEGDHLYYCGPTGLMDAIDAASSHWPTGTVHFERFSASEDFAGAVRSGDTEFEIELSSTGEIFNVPSDRTIVDVLKENGIDVDISCQEGYCGTCMTRYLSGVPVHRDSVLDEEDREEFLMICCARSYGKRLVLDL